MKLPIHPAISVLFLSALPIAAQASWTEGGARILTLDELLPRVGLAVGGTARTDLPGDTPVLLPPDADLESPKTIQVALVQSGLAVRPQDGGWSIVDASAKSEAARARTRIRPSTPQEPRSTESDGIRSGGLVLFGEVVAPPYRVETVGDAVEINGVAVFPVPGPAVAPPKPSRTQTETHDGMDAAVTAYRRNLGASGSARAKQTLVDDLRRLPGVTGAEWLNAETVRLIRPGGDGEIIHLVQDQREPDAPTAESLREALDAEAASLNEMLSENGTLFCGATYLLSNSSVDAGALRGRIEEILGSGESNALKIARLQAYTGHRDAAADLLFARVR